MLFTAALIAAGHFRLFAMVLRMLRGATGYPAGTSAPFTAGTNIAFLRWVLPPLPLALQLRCCVRDGVSVHRAVCVLLSFRDCCFFECTFMSAFVLVHNKGYLAPV
jgi:hypothetical protein